MIIGTKIPIENIKRSKPPLTIDPDVPAKVNIPAKTGPVQGEKPEAKTTPRKGGAQKESPLAHLGIGILLSLLSLLGSGIALSRTNPNMIRSAPPILDKRLLILFVRIYSALKNPKSPADTPRKM